MSNPTKSYESAIIKKLDKSRIEITGVIATPVWEAYRAEALKYLNEHVTIDGFRKGKIPEDVLIAKVGQGALLEEMAELALSKSYIEILINEKIDAIGKPDIRVTKLAPGNPLEFTATTSVVPTVTLPDYQTIAATAVKKSSGDTFEVSEKDIDAAILRIRRQHASHDGHDHEKMTPEEHTAAVDAALPELTDDFLKKLGDFKDIPDFRNKLSEMIAEQKKTEAGEKTRIRIADALTDAATIDIPEVMVESELGRTQAQFEADIERMGVNMDDYLKHAKKTLEEIRTEWRPHAERKAKLQLILNEIAIKENLRADAKEIETEVNHIVEHYKDADRERAAVYAETVLTNEKVFAFLEGRK